MRLLNASSAPPAPSSAESAHLTSLKRRREAPWLVMSLLVVVLTCVSVAIATSRWLLLSHVRLPPEPEPVVLNVSSWAGKRVMAIVAHPDDAETVVNHTAELGGELSLYISMAACKYVEDEGNELVFRAGFARSASPDDGVL